MGVLKPLYGSGPLTGIVEGSRISFIVNSVGFTISFDGEIQGTRITGTYLVSPMSGSTQEGDFYVAKTKAKAVSSTTTLNCPTDAEMNEP